MSLAEERGTEGMNVSIVCWDPTTVFRKDTTAVVGAFGLVMKFSSSTADSSDVEVVDLPSMVLAGLARDEEVLFILNLFFLRSRGCFSHIKPERP